MGGCTSFFRRPNLEARCQRARLRLQVGLQEQTFRSVHEEGTGHMSLNQEKEKAIELAMGAVERQFGKGSIMRLGVDEPLIRDIQVISTGALSLDIALGVGGVPRGRIVEIYGPESSGKTTLSLHVI